VFHQPHCQSQALSSWLPAEFPDRNLTLKVHTHPQTPGSQKSGRVTGREFWSVLIEVMTLTSQHVEVADHAENWGNIITATDARPEYLKKWAFG
jgi:hypothetical protein